jgi:menaquinone-9 beta-reductase
MSPVAPLNATYDVVVVGARCAGAATAMLLARRGLTVLVVDRDRYGSDTLSTHALMRGGVLQLHRWGLLPSIAAANTPPIRVTSFHYGERVLPIPIKPRDGVEALYAPRRTILDALLADGAAGAGAQLVYGARLLDLIRSAEGRVCGVRIEDRARGVLEIAADLVIGADGVRSTVARLAGAAPYRLGRHAAAVVYGYWSGFEADGYHWSWAPGVASGLIPTNDGLACLFAAMPARRFAGELRFDLAGGYRRVLNELEPALAPALDGARQVGTLRGFAGQTGFCRQSWGPGWALVGDAGYFKDPITAHGITDALRDAEILARAVAVGSSRALADYQALRDELSVGLLEVTDKIASFEWDLSMLQEWHRQLVEEMGREVNWLRQLDPDPLPGALLRPAELAGAPIVEESRHRRPVV